MRNPFLICLSVRDKNKWIILYLHSWIGGAQYLSCQCISECVSVCNVTATVSFHLKLTHILSKTGMIIRCWKTCYQQVCFPVRVKLSIASMSNAHKFKRDFPHIFGILAWFSALLSMKKEPEILLQLRVEKIPSLEFDLNF